MKCPEVVNRQYKGELPEFTFSLKNIFYSLRIRCASRVPCKLLTDKQMLQIPFLLLALMFVWLLKRVVVKKKRGSIPGQLLLSAPINDPAHVVTPLLQVAVTASYLLDHKTEFIEAGQFNLNASKSSVFFLYWRSLPLAAKFSGRGATPHRR